MHDGIGHMVHPRADTPRAGTPHLDGQCAGGTHPTGLYSCYYRQPLLNHIYDNKYVKQLISGERY